MLLYKALQFYLELFGLSTLLQPSRFSKEKVNNVNQEGRGWQMMLINKEEVDGQCWLTRKRLKDNVQQGRGWWMMSINKEEVDDVDQQGSSQWMMSINKEVADRWCQSTRKMLAKYCHDNNITCCHDNNITCFLNNYIWFWASGLHS